MAVPKVPTFNDFHFELVNLATGSFTNLDQSIVAISGWVGRGASRHRLESAHLEIIDGTVGAIALSWAGIQLLRIVPYADPTHELWGYISKDRYAYTKSGHRDSIKVTVLPIEYLLHSRIVYETDNAAVPPVAIATEAAPNNTGGDYAKTLVTACTHGRYPTAAAADTRDWAWGVLFVAAQVHDGAVVAPPMSLFAGFLDEAIDALGQTYAFDWELYVAVVAGVVQFTFTTADAGGADLTAGANRVIINDIGALVPSAERYFDRQGMINALHGGAISTAVLDAPSVATWGRWEGEVTTSVDEELQLVLDKSGIKEGSVFEFQASAASEQCQWMDEYEVGDTVKRNNVRLGIADNNEIIQAIEFSFPNRVLETRIRWGNKEPGDKEKTRQGRYTPFPPVPPTLWSRHAASAYLYPTTLGDDVRLKDAAGVDTLTMDAATGSQLWADAAQMTWESIDYRMPLVAPATGEALIATAGVPNQLSWGVPASSYWERGDLDSGAGVVTGLFTRFAGDPVMIGADNADLTGTPWVGTSGGTKLDVRGLLRVVRGVYANEASLALWGITGGVPIVHIVDESAAVGGAGGGACRFDVWNAAVRHHMLDADIARASYVRGFFEIHDAAGAIGHTFNAVTGAVILNEQGLNTGHVRIESAGSVNMVYIDAANDRVGILDGAPGHTFDVGGDINVVTGSGYMINDTATNRHVLIGDGTRGIFRALVAADLPAVSNIWTRVGTSVYTTNANDNVVPNAGTGTLGLVGDPWDNIFSVLGSFSGDVTLSGNPARLFFDDGGGGTECYLVNDNNKFYIGKTLAPSGANDIIIVDLATEYVGINRSPTEMLDVNGNIYFGTGAADAWLISAPASGGITNIKSTSVTGIIRFVRGGANTESVRIDGGGNLLLYNAGDFEVRDGAPGNLMASIDGATGTMSWPGAGSIGASGTDLFINGTGDDVIIRAADVVTFQTNGANTRWYVWSTGALLPTPTATHPVGGAANRCSNVYSVLCNFSGATTFNAVAYTWPGADGAGGSVLSTNGAGQLTWVAAGAPPATPWTDTGAFLHPTNARDVASDGAMAKWALYAATGNIWAFQTAKVGVGIVAGAYTSWIEAGYVYAGTGHMIDDLNVGMYEVPGFLALLTDQAIIAFAPGSAAEVYVEQGAMYPVATGVTSLGNAAGPLRWSNVYSVAGNFSGDVTIAGAAGIINTGAVANRFVLISDGVRFQGRALVAADLGGHLHVITGDVGAGTNHSHATSKATITGDFTPGTFRADIPVYLNQHPDTGTIVGYVHGTHHWHDNADYAWTYVATAGEAAHTHDEGTLVTAGPS